MTETPTTPAEPLFSCDSDHTRLRVVLNPLLANVPWPDVEQAGHDVIEQVNQQKKPSVIVDLSQLDYIASAIIALLVRVWKEIDARNGIMAVVVDNPQVLEIIELSGLTKVWKICDDVAAAETHIRAENHFAKNLSPFLTIVSLVATLISGGVYGLILSGMSAQKAEFLSGLQMGSALFGMLLGLWAGFTVRNRLRAVSFISGFLSLGLLGVAALTLAGKPPIAPRTPEQPLPAGPRDDSR